MSCPRPNVPRSNAKAVSELSEPLRSRIQTAIEDAPRNGLVLVSGNRDAGRQWDLRHERCKGRECDSSCKGYPVTARPGRSNHEGGRAADMGGRDLDWLIRNRAAYGLGLTVRSENWHFEASGTDSRTGHKIKGPTVTIRPYGGAKPQPKPLPKPIAKPEPQETFLMALTDLEQRELLTTVRRLDGTAERKPFAVRDPRDRKVWIIDGGTRTWVENAQALDLLIFTGQVQGWGSEGMAIADPAMLDGIEIA